ncbi:hypothetical protein PJL15_04239 [Paenarthrobacter nitroguajacolicus]|nr:hypothetical protein [Paenarthrobacter nitroguajacolicus]
MRTRYSGSRTTNAEYRERMSCSAVGASASPRWKRPQHSSYCSPERQGHAPFRSRAGSGVTARQSRLKMRAGQHIFPCEITASKQPCQSGLRRVIPSVRDPKLDKQAGWAMRASQNESQGRLRGGSDNTRHQPDLFGDARPGCADVSGPRVDCHHHSGGCRSGAACVCHSPGVDRNFPQEGLHPHRSPSRSAGIRAGPAAGGDRRS